MHTNSLPPSDRDETPVPEAAEDLAPSPASAKRIIRTYQEERFDHKSGKAKTFTVNIYQANEVLRAKLRDLRDAPSSIWSNATLGNKLGVSGALVSRYLPEEGNKYPSDITQFEKKVEDFLRALAERRASGIETCPTKIAEEIVLAYDYIRKNNLCGVIIVESGKGKSRASELILKENPLTIVLNITEWNNSKQGVMAALWAACPHDGYDRSMPRFPWLVTKMCGSDRPILVDNAHKLGRDALSLLITFHDETKCPMPLMGLPILVDKLVSDISGQTTSRVGVHWPIKINPKTDRKLLAHMIRSICKTIDGELDELVGLCQQVADHHGHFRAVEQRLKGAAELHRSNAAGTWVEAFRLAHSRSLHPCQLS